MRLHFVAKREQKAQDMLSYLISRYGTYEIDRAEYIVVLGGDGFILHMLHKILENNITTQVYGVNMGTIGFLTNKKRFGNIIENIHNSKEQIIKPLEINLYNIRGQESFAYAINEIYLSRQTHQAAKMSITIDNIRRMEELVGDGLIISTPVGSTAYNFSAGGPIIPVGSNLLSITGINAFRPKGWGYALIANDSRIRIDVLEHYKRPIYAVADFLEFKNISYVEISESKSKTIKLLFDNDMSLKERVLQEQFP